MAQSYKSTFKNTLAFGGVQVINIVLSIVRGKFIALYLGPVGMGINNLFINTLNLITTFNGLGLDFSAVRDVSESYESGDIKKIGRIKATVEKLFFYSGIIGAILTAVLSPFLSKWTFGNSDYTSSYILLSFFVLFTTLVKSQKTFMQGFRKVNFLLKSGLWSSFYSLIVSVPLFYFFRIQSIVPTLIITSLITLIVSSYYYKKIPVKKEKLPIHTVLKEGTKMIKLGIILVVATLIGMTVKYIISVAIGRMGNVKDVGLYTAAIAISGQYVGFILASLGTDYFPRLVAVHQDRVKMNVVVNEQTEIVLLLATPLLIFMMISSPFLIKILLSEEFLPITTFIRYIALGSFFQVASYCMGYISFAKNDRKTYLLLEGGISNILTLTSSLLGYYFYGLSGLAFAFLVTYIFYFVLIIAVAYKKYDFRIQKEGYYLFLINFSFITVSFLSFIVHNNVSISYISSLLMFFLSIGYSLFQLNKKMNIKDFVLRKIDMFKRKNK